MKEALLWGILGKETIPLDENALGRVLAEPILAKVSSPHYHAAAMDGFVAHADQTVGALPSKPIVLQIGEQARYVDTGDPVPEGFDSVIPIENVESLDEAGEIAKTVRTPKAIRIRAAVTPWSHIRMMGEDIIVTQLVLAAGQVLRPVDLGAVAAGYQEIQVARKPRGDPANRDRTGSHRKQAQLRANIRIQQPGSGCSSAELGWTGNKAANHCG